MLTPAAAALITRLLFYAPRFHDANLRLGKINGYFRFWALSLGITALAFLVYTVLGAVSWDLTGNVFLERLAEQFAAAGEDINETLPAGITPGMMLMLFFVGGLTVFNLFPGSLQAWRGSAIALHVSAAYRIKP
jgi:hypothetical protein